jgi:hypothetical protein
MLLIFKHRKEIKNGVIVHIYVWSKINGGPCATNDF